LGLNISVCVPPRTKRNLNSGYTLVILPKFAALYKDAVGFNLPEKAAALDQIIAYNLRDDAHAKPEAIDKIPELGQTIAETGRLLKMPGQSRTYGRWAKKDAIGRQTLEKYVAEFEAKIAELLGPGKCVLELGSGSGTHTYALLQTGAKVVASDISPNSLRLLSKRFSNCINLETVVADMESLRCEIVHVKRVLMLRGYSC
jgi:hypothetical protein